MDYLAQVDVEDKFLGKGAFLTKLADVGPLVSIIVSNAIIIAGVIVLFFFIFGGISMIAGAGQDNPEKAAKGKQALTSAIIGFIIIFASYWIVQLIEKLTGLAILNY